jgi:hypothetical protein
MRGPAIAGFQKGGGAGGFFRKPQPRRGVSGIFSGRAGEQVVTEQLSGGKVIESTTVH